ncbi:hypothetical protein [Streptomyces anandii]|uniref:Two-component sensor histidine kinase n=1 Tax=Streptomyces anandii TaxID=285454 RepID=A0ABW6HFA5_9ACTN
MDPGTYARLYEPPRPAPPPESPGLALLASALWVLNAVSLAWLTFLCAMVALWGAAEGQAVGDLVMTYVLVVAGGAGLLTALAFTPGVRRLSPAGRLLLTGVLACPVTTGVAVVTWVHAG